MIENCVMLDTQFLNVWQSFLQAAHHLPIDTYLDISALGVVSYRYQRRVVGLHRDTKENTGALPRLNPRLRKECAMAATSHPQDLSHVFVSRGPVSDL